MQQLGMHNDLLKKQAISLRKAGYSIKQISSMLPIAISTSSVWLQGVVLRKSAKARIDRRSVEARQRGALERKRRLSITYRVTEKLVQEQLASVNLNLYHKRLLCAFLYWGEGAKTGKVLKFTNSDPQLILIFLELFRESFQINEMKLSATLHLHSYHNDNKQLLFWSKVTKIPLHRIHIYRKENSGKRIKLDYPGCITIKYSNSRLYTALTGYYKYFRRAGFV